MSWLVDLASLAFISPMTLAFFSSAYFTMLPEHWRGSCSISFRAQNSTITQPKYLGLLSINFLDCSDKLLWRKLIFFMTRYIGKTTVKYPPPPYDLWPNNLCLLTKTAIEPSRRSFLWSIASNVFIGKILENNQFELQPVPKDCYILFFFNLF